jgi:protein ImuB
MKTILSIWLPHLAIERWAKTTDYAPDAPVVLTVEGTHGLIIHAVTQGAATSGAWPGARLTDARALDPGLIAIPADPEGDSALLQRLARWAGRWSPLVEVDGADGLRLDVSGVAHLFGGEAGLAEDVRGRFGSLGLTARIAIAPTAAAAWALARFSPSPLCGRGREPRSGGRERGWRGRTPSPRSPSASRPLPQRGEGLEKLPVAALRLEPETVRTLERLGLKTIGALTAMPRLALARRFRGAENVVDALDRMTGRKDEPLTASRAEPPPHAVLRLEEPATHPEAAGQALERLIPALVEELEQRHLGARRLSLTGYRVDGSTAVAGVTTTIPSREPKHLQRLLADKAAALNPDFGFDAFTLTADWTESLGAAQESLVEEPSGTSDVARLVDRLTVKLGAGAVRRPQAQESHLPERASGWVAAVASPPLQGRGLRGGVFSKGLNALEKAPERASSPLVRDPPSPQPACPPNRPERRSPSLEREGRPQKLLDRPEAIDVIYATPEGVPRRFVWRRAVHDIARVEGPERIAPEWWRQASTSRLRDYYRVEDGEGRRYWIYREGLIGDGRGGVPNWFIHGLFG